MKSCAWNSRNRDSTEITPAQLFSCSALIFHHHDDTPFFYLFLEQITPSATFCG